MVEVNRIKVSHDAGGGEIRSVTTDIPTTTSWGGKDGWSEWLDGVGSAARSGGFYVATADDTRLVVAFPARNIVRIEPVS